jgi:hypothetical protein
MLSQQTPPQLPGPHLLVETEESFPWGVTPPSSPLGEFPPSPFSIDGGAASAPWPTAV